MNPHRPNSSSLHGNFQLLFCLPLLFGTAGCGGGDQDDPAPICENPDTPTVLALKDIAPARDSTVPNEDIVHAFTVVDATATFSNFAFTYGAGHEAGSPSPDALKFTAEPSGTDVTYTFKPLVWQKSGHVELVETGEYADQDGCFILPRPVFSYDVED